VSGEIDPVRGHALQPDRVQGARFSRGSVVDAAASSEPSALCLEVARARRRSAALRARKRSGRVELDSATVRTVYSGAT